MKDSGIFGQVNRRHDQDVHPLVLQHDPSERAPGRLGPVRTGLHTGSLRT